MDDHRTPTPGAGEREIPLSLVGAIFAVSGMAALVYQVAWQRILALHSGVGIYSVSVIVAAFLAGLGLGSAWGGKLSVDTSPRSALRAFGAIELGIGLFALASCWIYYDLLYLRLPGVFANPWGAGAAHFLLLVIPTTLMGMSLPLLVRAAVADPVSASRTIGRLYGLNVLGAALGALAAPWILMRLTGVRGAVAIAALGNLAAGVVALAVARRPFVPASGEADPPPVAGAEPAGSRPLLLWALLYATSGFCALSLEILWFRLVDVAVKSTAFTFGTVLAIFLGGLGLGSLLGARSAPRVAQPLRVFLLCQSALLAYAGLAVLLMVTLPEGLPGYSRLVAHWAQYEEFPLGAVWDWGKILTLYGLVPLVLYGPPTILMGISFCVLQRAVQDDRRTSGLKVGLLQAANIGGNVAGSLVTGLVLLGAVGTAGTLRTLMLVGLAFALGGLRVYGVTPSFAALAVTLLLLAGALPTNERLWQRLHGVSGESGLFAEDATAVTAVTPDEGSLRVSVDGKGHSWLPFGGIHSQLGALPAAMHRAPQRVAIVGLGSGDTAWASAFRRETEAVRVFEISAPQRGLLQRTASMAQLPRLTSFLEDRRIQVLTADGRNALALGADQYDLIEADALRPHSAYAGNLYSVEFFELCARRLNPNGLMCSWSPTPRVYVSFCQAFPHVVDFGGGSILVGSNEPIPIDVAAWAARLNSDEARAYFDPRILAEMLQILRTAQPATPALVAHVAANRDLFPRDEFRSPAQR